MDSRIFRELTAVDRVQRMRQKIAELKLEIQRDLEKEQKEEEKTFC
jgi:hypothetical protein